MGLQTINTIQSGINSNYSDRYIKQALANLGQRTGAKGDSIINSSFKLKDLLPIESNSYMVATYINNDKIRLQDSSNENNYCELFSINEVSNVLIKLLESMPSQQTNNNIKQLADVKILKNPDSYFFISKCVDTNDLLDSIVCFEFSEETEQLINGVVIIPKTGNVSYYELENIDGNIVIKNNRINNIVTTFNSDNIYENIINEISVNSIIETINNGVVLFTTDILSSEDQEPLLNKIKYYTLNYPKYIKASFNNIVYYENDSYIGLKKSIIFNFIEEVFNNSGYPSETGKVEFKMYFPKDTEFLYIINENTRTIYFSYDILVYYNTDLKINTNIDLELSREVKNHIVAGSDKQNKISIYKFIVNYINEDKYIDSIVVNKVQTLPFIQENKDTETNVWVLNDVETDIPATGEDAGNPNIMMLSFTKQNDNEQVQVLHTYDDHNFKETIEEYYKNKANLIDYSFDYDSTFYVSVNNESFFNFEIQLPDINSLLVKNYHYGKIIKNTLLWTFVDLKYCNTIVEYIDPNTNESVKCSLNDLVHGTDTNGNDPGKASFITVFWQVVKDNDEYKWKVIPNYLFNKVNSNNTTNLPALDLASMIGLKDMVNYYLNNLYDPDKFLHNWLVFDPIFTSEKQNGESVNESLEKAFYPLFKVDSSTYYNIDLNKINNIYNNNLNIVPKFLKQKQDDESIISFSNNGKYLIENISDSNVNDNYFKVNEDNTISKISALDNGDYVPNADSENIYPMFDFREVLTFNQTLINRLDILSFDKDKKVYHAFIGNDVEKGDPSILTIGTSDKNKNMENSQTLPDNNFGTYDRICVDMPLNETEDAKFEKLIINKDSNGNYFSIVTVDVDNTLYILDEVVTEIPATKYMPKLEVKRKTFYASEYVKQFPHLVLSNNTNDPKDHITCEVINNTDDTTFDHSNKVDTACKDCVNGTFGYSRLSFILYFDKIEGDYRVSLKHCEQLISSSNYILGPTIDVGAIDIPFTISLVNMPNNSSCVKLRYYIKKNNNSPISIDSYFTDNIFNNLNLRYSYSPYDKYDKAISLTKDIVKKSGTENFYNSADIFDYIEFNIPFKSSNNIYFVSNKEGNGYSPNEFINIKCTNKHTVSGNIESLVKEIKDIREINTEETPEGKGRSSKITNKTRNIFPNLFANNENIIDAVNLRLPLTVEEFCYYNMFNGCKSLTIPPILNSTDVQPYCYCNMFNGCEKLVKAPELKSSNIDICCYYGMFTGCSLLTKMPELKSNKIAPWCYTKMFNNCELLEDINIKYNKFGVDEDRLLSYFSKYYEIIDNTVTVNDLGKFYSHTPDKNIMDGIIFSSDNLYNFCQSPFLATFRGCRSLKDLSHIKLVLDSTISNNDLLTKYKTNDCIWGCFSQIFRDCVSLEKAPIIQKTKISSHDFSNTYNSCVSLKEVKLPGYSEAVEFSFHENATDIYNGIFDKCVSLEKVTGFYSNLKTVKKGYYNMFKYCVSLQSIPELNATPNISSYANMFYGCKSLTDVILKFTSVGQQADTHNVGSCYQMFKNCSFLDNISVDFIDWNNKVTKNDKTEIITNPNSTLLATYHWLENTYSIGSGTFLCYNELPHSGDYINNVSFINKDKAKVLVRPDKNDYFFIDIINTNNILRKINIELVNLSGNVPENEQEENISSIDLNQLSYYIYNTNDNITSCSYCEGNDLKTSGFGVGSFDQTTGSFIDGEFTNMSSNIIEIVDNKTRDISDDKQYVKDKSGENTEFGKTIRIYFKYNSDEIKNKFGYRFTIKLYTGEQNSVGFIDTYTELNETNIKDCHYHIGGDIITLLKNSVFDYRNDVELLDNSFEYLFSNEILLKSAIELKLPEYIISDNCYSNMFINCVNLNFGPIIKCNLTAVKCYESMYEGCITLKGLAKTNNSPSTLPAKTLSDYCYLNMFKDCEELENIPVLPATTLATGCYYGMFQNCKKINNAPNLPASILSNKCYENMFNGCENLNKINLKYYNEQNNPVDLTQFITIKEENKYKYTNDWVKGVKTKKGVFSYNTNNNANDLENYWSKTFFNDSVIPSSWLPSIAQNYFWIELTDDITPDNVKIKINTEHDKIQYYIDKSKAKTILLPEGESSINIDFNDWTYYKLNKTIITEGETTTEVLVPEEISISKNDRIYFRYNHNNVEFLKPFGTFEINYIDNDDNIQKAKYNVGGSLITLYTNKQANINNNKFDYNVTNKEIPEGVTNYGAFGKLFYSSNIVDASELILPTDVMYLCYKSMFKNCQSLTSSPELPAEKLKEGCYETMFEGCTSLTQAPKLKSESLASSCYQSMFAGCTNLIGVFDLLAEDIYPRSYANMFYGCTSLIVAPIIKGKSFKEKSCNSMFYGCKNLTIIQNIFGELSENEEISLYKYSHKSMFEGCTNITTVPENLLPSEVLAPGCYETMFEGCTSLTQAPSLPAKKLSSACYQSMFAGCRALKSIELPGTELVNDCYNYMFWGCIELESVTVNFTKWKDNCTNSWFKSNEGNPMKSEGIFNCPEELEIPEERSVSTILDGWEVKYI